MELDDTIVAVASAAGGAVRGVVRLSGPEAVRLAGAMCIDPPPAGLRSATAVDTAIRLEAARSLPARLYVWPTTRSYTRQPTVELHTIGAPPLLDRIVRQACTSGARLARPGEFTLRAFLAGRLDLTQAEAVLGVIDAGSEQALRAALGQLAGGIATPIAALREALLVLLADLEAGLDFADEDIEFISADVLAARLESVASALERLVEQVERRRVGTELPRAVLAGPVNAGKSSLFNAMVRRFGDPLTEVEAIESPEPGATRDYLQAAVRLAGTPCVLVDTAGAEELDLADTPAAHAQRMRLAAYQRAEVFVWCQEVGGSPGLPPAGARELAVATKCDAEPHADSHQALPTSAKTGWGLDALAAAIAKRLDAGGESLVPSTAERSVGSLRAALVAVQAAMELSKTGLSEELVATELRAALGELGQVAGVVYTDDVLDRVFSRFCIGK